jgi:NADH-quinone oxidoreductase subunit E
MRMDLNGIDTVVQKCGTDNSSLVAILQEVQRREGHLPRQTLSRLSRRLDVPLSRLYALATFYRSFTLVPTGRHRVCVCLGTACHVRGAQGILDRLERVLGVGAGDTTPDRRFTLETVRCLGCCSIGPVARIDAETFGRLRQDKVAKILEPFR